MKTFFLIIPALNQTGPIKGAVAFANALAGERKVVIMSIKKANPNSLLFQEIDERVKHICLHNFSRNYLIRLIKYRNMLKNEGGRRKVISLSYCFSADLFNLFCKKHSINCSSIRGDIIINYRNDYGKLGLLLAYFHFKVLRWFDMVVAMSNSMYHQIESYSGVKPAVIYNFINETPYKNVPKSIKKDNFLSFIFVGSLSNRKQPMLIVKALSILHKQGKMARLSFVGDGPLLFQLQSQIKSLKLDNYVKFHGFLNNPLEVISKADVMVLPSLAEGISRAALESLYLGVPCVLRNTGGNSELISEEKNGSLFNEDSELVAAMIRASVTSKKNYHRRTLLPLNFQQDYASKKYLKLLESINE